MKGHYPREYFDNPYVNKSADDIFADLNSYSIEIEQDEPQRLSQLNMFVLLPPLEYEGRFVKGLFYSQGVDVLYGRYSYLGDLFLSIGKLDVVFYTTIKTRGRLLCTLPKLETQQMVSTDIS